MKTPVQRIITHLKKYDWPITMAEETSWLTAEEEIIKSAYSAGYLDSQCKIYDPRHYIETLKDKQTQGGNK